MIRYPKIPFYRDEAQTLFTYITYSANIKSHFNPKSTIY